VLVCWDQWYPEAARLMALAGAELLLYPTAIGWNPQDTPEEQARQRDAWITIQRSHAVANNIPVLSANRIGFESDPSGQTAGSQFWGSSMIVGWQGELLAQADTSSATELVVELDLDRTEQVRRWWPYLRDRRIDAYEDLVKRYRD
jgi:N-carbamoylputrescine amidase